jgi:hypothetical protein
MFWSVSPVGFVTGARCGDEGETDLRGDEACAIADPSRAQDFGEQHDHGQEDQSEHQHERAHRPTLTTARVWDLKALETYCGMRASRAAPSASRTGSSSIRSSTSWKKPRTISRSASALVNPRAIA